MWVLKGNQKEPTLKRHPLKKRRPPFGGSNLTKATLVRASDLRAVGHVRGSEELAVVFTPGAFLAFNQAVSSTFDFAELSRARVVGRGFTPFLTGVLFGCLVV